MPEAFANAREAARRTLGLRPFDVQLMGGIFLHQGNISEMKTGEGKTLMATLPVYLNALTGRGVHVVTVNDYLARRDAEWMGLVYHALGLSVGVVVPGMEEPEKKVAYNADVTYATNNELGFDYLRDNMKSDLTQVLQRDHYFAIVDEVDSILIDEARTPLIISGPSQDRSELYVSIDKLIPKLTAEHYDLDEKQRTTTLTENGNEFVERRLREMELLAQDATLYDPESTNIVHHVNQALRAHVLFHKDKDYIVRNGEVMLIDAAGLQLVHDAQPELGAFGLLDPDAENLLGALRQDAERDVDRLVADEALVADLDPNGIEEHQRVADIERPVLPFRHLVQHRVGDRRDQVRRDIDAIEFLEMAADLAHRHAAGIHRDDLLVEVREAALILGDQLRIEGPGPIARHR